MAMQSTGTATPAHTTYVSFASLLSVSIGIMVLTGWFFAIAPLKSVFAWSVSMKANGAVAFILVGISLWLLRTEESRSGQRMVAQFCAASASLIGLLSLLQYLFTWDLAIDQILFLDQTSVETSHPGRMAPSSAVSFAMLGIALCLIDIESRRGLRISQYLCVLVATVSYLALVGYVLGLHSLYRVSEFTSIAIHGAFTFLILSVGILYARPDRGFMAVLTNNLPGGRMWRRLLPAILGIPLLTGILVTELSYLAFFEVTDETPILVSLLTLVFASLIWFHARSLNETEKRILYANHLYAVLSHVNRTIIRIGDADRLFAEVCSLVLREGSFKAVFIGLFEDDAGSMTIKANASEHVGFFESTGLEILNGDSTLTPYFETIRAGKPVICNDIDKEPLGFPCSRKAEERRCLAFASFPIQKNGRAIGALSVFAAERGFFQPDEVRLLRQVTEDISFALDAIDRESERHNAEAALRESEERYRIMAETATDAIVTINGNSKILFVNHAAEEVFGYALDELSGEDLTILMPEYLRHVHKSGIRRYLDTGERHIPWSGVELVGLNKSGKEFPVEVSFGEIIRNGEHLFTGIIRDITERKLAEEALRASEEEYRSFFEDDLTADYISTPEGELVACNPAFARIFGFASVDEAKRKNVGSLYRDLRERDVMLRKLRQERKLEYYEIEMLRQDGKPIHMIANIIGQFDGRENLVRIKGYLFDDTERRKLERQLIQSQKMEGIGTLAGGIAHDFNNILGIVLGHATLLDREDRERIKESAEAIERAARRGASLVRQLLTFARKADVRFEAVRVNDTIRELMKLLHETFPKTIEITTNLDSDLPSIRADATQIHQVLLNLCLNARDAMPSGGSLVLSTKIVPAKSLWSRFPSARANSYAEIDVSDTGTGMDELTRARIFEPFFTTKGPGRGTGLGLAVVFGIIEDHSGFIDVDTEVGAGTTFSLFFPIEETVTAFDEGEVSATEVRGGTETILFVEDEEMLRELVRIMLVNNGYSVMTADNGIEALDLYRRHRAEIDLILTDIGLPRMDGREMVKQILQMNPSARVLIASGFLDPQARLETQKAGVKGFIQKPYVPAEVATTIRRVLDDQKAGGTD